MATSANLAPYLAVVLSVAATQVLLVFSECHDNCRGYMGRGLFRMWPFLIAALAIQSVLGFFLYELAISTLLSSDQILQRVVGAGAVGFAAVVLPNGLMARRVAKLLARPSADLARDLERPLSRIFLWMWVLRHFKAAAQGLKSVDNFSYQFQEDDWDFSLSDDKKRRRGFQGVACAFSSSYKRRKSPTSVASLNCSAWMLISFQATGSFFS
jgi:hypothetical protein